MRFARGRALGLVGFGLALLVGSSPGCAGNDDTVPIEPSAGNAGNGGDTEVLAGRGGTAGGGRAGSSNAGEGSSSGTGGTGEVPAGGEGGESEEPGDGGTAGALEAGRAGQTSGQGGDAGASSAEAGESGAPGAVAGDSGSGGSAGGSAGTGGSVPFVEAEPNDFSGEATELPIDTDVHGAIDPVNDHDYFEFGAPSERPSGGYFTWSLTGVGPSTPSVTVYTVTDDDLLDSQAAGSAGASLFGFFAAAPGARFRILVERESAGGAEPFGYVLRADYHPIADPYEPNETQARAAEIELGVPATAYLFAGFEDSTLPPARFDDWYAFTADAGEIEVSIDDFPLNAELWVRVYASNLQGIGAREQSSEPGATVTFRRTLVASGTYFVCILHNGATPESKGAWSPNGELPDHFTRPYTLAVGRP
ncbi:MAG TPA: hypothetical protein VGK73_00400 [Polyangiaceae bacterium]